MKSGESFEMNLLAAASDGPANAPISPRLELGAYEALWLVSGATFLKTIATRFAAIQMRSHPILCRVRRPKRARAMCWRF